MIIEKHLSDGHQIPREQTEKFIRLFGSWEGMETAESIVHAIRSARKNSGRFKVQNALFN